MFPVPRKKVVEKWSQMIGQNQKHNVSNGALQKWRWIVNEKMVFTRDCQAIGMMPNQSSIK